MIPSRPRRTPALRSLGGAMLTGGLLALVPQTAFGQAIERNPAPAPQPPAPLARPEIAADASSDATPLGMALGSIAIGDGATVAPAAPGAVVLATARPMPRLEARLRPYLGRPLSLRLIADIKAEVARAWRDAGYPFVHVSAPEQDLSEGRLVLRVAEYRLGTARVEGVGEAGARRIAGAIRQAPGEPIGFDALAEDLDWVNRYPFRRVEAVFAPADTAGATDVVYKAREVTPISVGGGYANSGSPRTGRDRYFFNLLAGVPGTDIWGSYQLTTSGQRLADLGHVPVGSKRYVSHSARVTAPVSPRAYLELDFADIVSSQPVQAFDSRQHTREWSLTGHLALSALAASLQGELYAGIDWKTQRGKLRFGATTISRTEYDVGQFNLGYAWHGYDSTGETGLDVSVHFSPGGITDRNTGRAFALASRGGFDQSQYLYTTGSVYRRTRFGKFDLVQSIDWQIAGTALPQTEQRGLGGPGQVRAYTLDDGAFDRIVLARNQLRWNAGVLGTGRTAVQWTPSLFVESGYAGRAGGEDSRVVGSAGLGLDLGFANHLAVSADAAVALADQGETRAGDVRGNVRVSLRF